MTITLKHQISELVNSGSTKKEIVDALKRLDSDVRDTGRLDHLPKESKDEIRASVKSRSILIYKAIKGVIKEEGEMYLKHMDC